MAIAITIGRIARFRQQQPLNRPERGSSIVLGPADAALHVSQMSIMTVLNEAETTIAQRKGHYIEKIPITAMTDQNDKGTT